MIRFNRVLFVSALMSLPMAASALEAGFVAKADVTYAERVVTPQTPASLRSFLTADQTWVLSDNWAAKLGVQGWTEGMHKNYLEEDVSRGDLSDLRVQDAFVEGSSDHWIFRLGNQQVVWGETFGHFISDVINPRDLRYGVPLDISRTRLSTPMANLKYVGDQFFVQGIFLPGTNFDLLPSPGSDFAPLLTRATPYSGFHIDREAPLATQWTNASGGGRTGFTWGSTDLSAFVFGSYDHNPSYEFEAPPAPGEIAVVRERHGRAVASGLTFASDFDGWILRGEVVSTDHQFLPIIDGNTISSVAVRELADVISIDFPSWQNLTLFLQWEESRYPEQQSYLLRTAPLVQYASSRVIWNWTKDLKLDLIATYSPADRGYRTIGEISYAMFSNLESRIGIESYNGPYLSDFGQISHASRAYVSLRLFAIH